MSQTEVTGHITVLAATMTITVLIMIKVTGHVPAASSGRDTMLSSRVVKGTSAKGDTVVKRRVPIPAIARTGRTETTVPNVVAVMEQEAIERHTTLTQNTVPRNALHIVRLQ